MRVLHREPVASLSSKPPRGRRSLRAIGLSIAAACAVLLWPVGLEAAPHRARLSRDLAERLAGASNASDDVIVEADRATLEALASRYGVRIKRYLRRGAVLELNGGQLDALSQDEAVDHLSTDARVYRMMAVTTVATGADQVWPGFEGLRGLTGRGVGVAVIDSGIDNHPAPRARSPRLAAWSWAGPARPRAPRAASACSARARPNPDRV